MDYCKIIGVETNSSRIIVIQSPDLPCPTITTEAEEGGAGWIILEWKPETEFVKSKNQNDITYD